MQRFVHAQNLRRYIDLLESETDPSRLGQIQKLLIEEIDRSGTLAEQVDQADQIIVDGQARLRRRQAIVASLQTEGRDTATARATLAAVSETLDVIAQHRRTLLAEIERTKP